MRRLPCSLLLVFLFGATSMRAQAMRIRPDMTILFAAPKAAAPANGST